MTHKEITVLATPHFGGALLIRCSVQTAEKCCQRTDQYVTTLKRPKAGNRDGLKTLRRTTLVAQSHFSSLILILLDCTTQMRATRSIAVAILVSVIFIAWASAEVRGDRVGYSFEGAFIQPIWNGTGQPPTEYNVFGVSFPFEAPFTGAFSYDTTADNTEPFAGTKDFKQRIQGGFTFNVFSSIGGPEVLQLVANTYVIRVTNDYLPSGAPDASDLLSVEFNTLADTSLPSIIKNGSPYTKKPILITAPLSWNWPTFNDPDEPKLRSDLPHNDFFPFQGSMVAQGTATFAIRSFLRISPSAGDYNIDGMVDGIDYPAWRKAFGQTSPDFSYADGNHDGIVDAADYVIWRRATGTSASAGSMLVPEPSAIVLAEVSLLILAGYRRRFLCR
jgi:hypothetical protein